jgi:hypothetical protein
MFHSHRSRRAGIPAYRVREAMNTVLSHKVLRVAFLTLQVHRASEASVSHPEDTLIVKICPYNEW